MCIRDRGVVGEALPRPSTAGSARGVVWSPNHALLARIGFRLSRSPSQHAARDSTEQAAREALWASQIEAATYPPDRTSAKSLFQRATTLIQVDLKRADGRSNTDMEAARAALVRALEMLDAEDVRRGPPYPLASMFCFCRL